MKWITTFASVCLLVLSVGCSSTKSTLTTATTSAEENQNLGNISLLDRLRQKAGLNILGSGSRAEIYLSDVSSVNTTNQVLFIIDGVQVGDFSKAASTLNPLEIGTIRVLKNPRDLVQYGFMGAGGAIIINTKK
jgi:outer membrane cobalamin receptor